MATRHYLAFDRRISYGSPEHFFHFMWGYLLPSLHTITTLTNPESSQYLFESCGPLMDSRICEMMRLFNYDFVFVPKISNEKDRDFNQLTIPRWDIALLGEHLFGQDTDADIHTLRLRAELAKDTCRYSQFRHNIFRSELSSSIHNIRSDVLQQTNTMDIQRDLDIYAGYHLLLARSSCPDFYAEGGQAEILGYGTSRRALLGVHGVAQQLREQNLRVLIFEPGKHSLIEQIRVFQHCKGVIGIKGAEFANLIWMKPQSQVILIRPTGMNTPPVQKELADILRLRYIEIEDQQGRFSIPAPKTIASYLES